MGLVATETHFCRLCRHMTHIQQNFVHSLCGVSAGAVPVDPERRRPHDQRGDPQGLGEI